MVQSAKFGRTRVDVWREPEGSPIYRGDPPREVGRFPPMWRFVVCGELSGSALTEAAAKAEAERRAWDSAANQHASAPRLLYALSPAEQSSHTTALNLLLTDIATAFPADFEPA